jgi:hypothetical protein
MGVPQEVGIGTGFPRSDATKRAIMLRSAWGEIHFTSAVLPIGFEKAAPSVIARFTMPG